LKSTDGGNTWTHIPGPWDTNEGGAKINKVIVIPGPIAGNPNDDFVLVAGNTGLFHSTQGGSDFSAGSTPVLGAETARRGISDVVLDMSDLMTLYAVWNGVGIYRSTDAGLTWDADTSDPDVDPIWTSTPPCLIRRGALALAPTNTNILYAAFQTDPNLCGSDWGGGAVFRTSKAKSQNPTFNQLTYPVWPPGDAWAGVGFCRSQCWYDLAIIVQPNDPDGPGPLNPEDIVYVGGVGLFRSTDGGSTWISLGRDSVHADFHAFAFDDNYALYVGNDGGIYRHPSPATAQYTDPGWVNLNTNLALTQFYKGVTVNPKSVQPGKTLALGGTQDNGSMKYTGSLQWEVLSTAAMGDGSYTAFDYDDPDNVWYWSGWYANISKTIDNGGSWINANKGLVKINNHFIAPFVVCSDNPQILIASDDWGVYRTNDGAGTWFGNSPHLTDMSPTALAFAPGSGGNTYFAGFPSAMGRLYRTTTGGGTSWDDWDNITTNLPHRWLKDIAVHPTNSNTVYICFSGFCGNNATCPANQGHVWRTNNALASNPANVTWTDLTGGKGLPNVPVNAVVLDHADPNRLYIGTDLGVYRSLDAGTTWGLFDNGLPNVAITDLAISYNTGVLVAATYGRSIFRLAGAVYVDASWTGNEDGTVQFPYNTVSEGVSAVPIRDQLWMKAGTYTGTDNVPITISKAMTIRSYGGTAILGP
jgi:photosystem II stability/assembly factor-like uncharacterized protein